MNPIEVRAHIKYAIMETARYVVTLEKKIGVSWEVARYVGTFDSVLDGIKAGDRAGSDFVDKSNTIARHYRYVGAWSDTVKLPD